MITTDLEENRSLTGTARIGISWRHEEDRAFYLLADEEGPTRIPRLSHRHRGLLWADGGSGYEDRCCNYPDESNQPDLLERWFSDGTDIRRDSVIGEKVSSFLRQHKTRSVVIADGILGCPHEEGVDYPEGKSCPKCPYWAGRDRFTLEQIQ
jgi:hypothetical protein